MTLLGRGVFAPLEPQAATLARQRMKVILTNRGRGIDGG
jgi:hypothetical protein